MIKVKRSTFTDTDYSNLMDRLESVLEGWRRAGYNIIDILFSGSPVPSGTWTATVFHEFDDKQ